MTISGQNHAIQLESSPLPTDTGLASVTDTANGI